MYTKWFGFREFPFNVSCDSRFFYANRAYQESYIDLRYGIKLRKGLIVLTGETGTGKSTLIEMVQDRCESNIHMAVVSNCGRDIAELLRLTMQAFGLKDLPLDRHAMIPRFKAYLTDQLKHGHIVAMAIDEAQDLDLQTLNELESISELQSADQNLCQIVLAGRPELTTKLESPALWSLRKRVAVWREVGPLKPDEIGAYIEHRLVVAGYQGKGLFEPDAVEQIAVYSSGIPGLINVICDNACLFAYNTEGNTITSGTIRKVCDHLHLREECSLSGSVSRPTEKDSVCQSGASDSRDGEGQFCLEERMVGLESKRYEKRRGSASPILRISIATAILFLAVTMVMFHTRQDEIPATKHYAGVPIRQEGNQQTGKDVPDEVVEKKSADDESPLRPVTSLDVLAAQKELRLEAVIYLHTSENNDRSVLKEIGDALRTKGYTVADTRLTRGRTQGDVRFFFLQDRANAERIKFVVESELVRRGYPIALQLLERDGRKFQFAAPGKIEVWLPPCLTHDPKSDSMPEACVATRQR
jgi:type II secretory pathway predicted ATPase ExeA